MKISIVVAVSENNVIGKEGKLPWHLPRDLKYFKATTWGKPIVMGRKTFESIGRVLPGRENWILSRDVTWAHEGCIRFSDINPAIEMAHKRALPEIMIVGGGQVYRAVLPYATDLYITRVNVIVEGDTYFPEIVKSEWVQQRAECFPADEMNSHAAVFEHWLRRA